MTNFERKPSTEDADILSIARDILIVQAQFAASQHRPLGRGTHTKGICVRAEFDVRDLRGTVADPGLAARLATGIYATPGVYPATVRFANAASTIQDDSTGDVRALSFSVELPPGVAGPAASRVDFSMNNAPTFPINDAHAFAVAMKVLSANGKLARLKALWSLSFKDLLGFARTGMLGKQQQRRATQAYQQMRFWSNVPFSHGPNEAVKYSALPSPGNPAQPLQTGPNFLQDELVRHVNEDERLSSFDLGLQFLDTAQMTHGGRHREASFWIENASVEWKEAQAPFHVVARLRLLPRSVLTAEACNAAYIDVTKYAAPDSRPLGGINRARSNAEGASRRARLEGTIDPGDIVVPAAPRRSTVRRVLGWGTLLLVLGLAALAALVVGFSIYYKHEAAANIPAADPIADVRYLNQGWGASREAPDREAYYYTAQGAPLHDIRYSWFVNFERPFRDTRFADPDYLRSLNFIVEPVPTHANPDQLPVGIARRYDDTLNDYVVDVTCAACHTGQLNVTRAGKTTAIRIDGGQGMHAFTDMDLGHFVPELGLSVITTAANPFKFLRFSRKVLGPDSTWRDKRKLWLDLVGVTGKLLQAERGSFNTKHYPTQEGFGRTDALARIANTVFGDHIDPANYRTGNAPVSFPFLWNIWKFDWVQYGASVSQPMARNVGEAMGTGASFQLVDSFGRPIPAAERYRTTISFDNLLRIEQTLQTLTPPQWPEDLLGRINHERATNGAKLYAQYCVDCHGPHVAADALTHSVAPGRAAGDPLWVIRWKELQDIGTDPTAALNFVNNTLDLSRTGLKIDDVRQLLKREMEMQKARQAGLVPALQQELAKKKAAGAPQATLDEITTELYDAQKWDLTDDAIAAALDKVDLTKVTSGAGLNILGLMIRDRYYADRHFSDQARACYEGFGMLDLPQVVPGYKPRPHEGVWATPPFLHNGSVPNLYELLSPVAERSKRFFVGRREFDPVKVGYVTEPKPGTSSGFWFDTSLEGNHNTGHEFRAGYVPFDESKPASAQYQGGVIGPALSPEQRMEIIEYLKIHRDDPMTPPKHVPPDCVALIKGGA